jgi:hypothetical protein
MEYNYKGNQGIKKALPVYGKALPFIKILML